MTEERYLLLFLFFIYFPDNVLRVIAHSQEHPSDIFADHAECDKYDAGEDDDGHHRGRPAEYLGLADDLADKQPDETENAAHGSEDAEPLSKAERNYGESGDVGPEAEKLLECIA